MFIKYFFVLLSGFLLSLLFINRFKKLTFLKRISKDEKVSLIGGLCVLLAFIFSCLGGFFVFRLASLTVAGILISSAIMFVFGLLDDYRELSVLKKFFAQIVATSILIYFGVKTQILYIGEPANILITFIWVIGITNAFNLLDVLDGLSAGVALLAIASFFSISLLNGDTSIVILALSLIGPILGFLLFNFPPAKVYLGNAGSHFLGFTLAATALLVRYASLETKIALVSPLLILGLPIFDTLFLMAMRISKKKLPFKKSNDHLPLRLLAMGYSKRKALGKMLLLGLFFSICGVLITGLPKPGSIGIIIFAVLLVLTLARKMSRVVVNE